MTRNNAASSALRDAAGGSLWDSLKAVRSSRAMLDGFPLRLCVGLSLLLILFVWFDVSGIVHKLFSIDARFVLIAIGLFALQFIMSCVRWVFILDRQGVGIDARRALSIFGIGTLANLFLVTSIAGISVRAALLLRAGTALSGALASVTSERIAATAGLLLCAAVGFAFAFPQMQSLLGEWAPTQTAVYVLAGGAVLAGAAVLILHRMEGPRAFARKVWASFSSLRQAILLIGVSAAIVVMGFAGMAALATGLGLAIDPLFFLSVMPAIAFVSALPISVGGWGVREGAMVAGLSIFAVPPESAMALSVSYGLGGLLVALLLGSALALLGQTREEKLLDG